MRFVGTAIIACVKRSWVPYVLHQVTPLMPALVAHAEQQVAAEGTANFADYDALTVALALHMDKGRRPGLSTADLPRELQIIRFKLCTREKRLAAAVYMAAASGTAGNMGHPCF